MINTSLITRLKRCYHIQILAKQYAECLLHEPSLLACISSHESPVAQCSGRAPLLVIKTS